MHILAFDTSLDGSCVALSRDDKVIGSAVHPIVKGQADQLLPSIEEILQAANLTFKDIDLFAVTTGPGSFTGIRIGLAAAQGFRISTGKKTLAFSTLHAIAAPLNAGALVIELSGKGGLHVALYDKDLNISVPPSEIEIAQLESFEMPEGYVLAGSAAESAQRFFPAHKIIAPAKNRAIGLCHLAHLFQNNDSYADLSPIYLREADVTLPKAV